MTFFLHLLWVAVTSLWRPRIGLADESVITVIAWPTETGFQFMHQDAYTNIMELGRWDLMLRSRSLGDVLRTGWAPVVAAQGIRYRRPIARFTRYTLRTRAVFWTDRDIYTEHIFERRDEVMARGVVRCRVRAKGKTMSLTEIARRLGHGEPPPQPAWLPAWSACEEQVLSAHPSRNGERADSERDEREAERESSVAN